jgi:hypothetical protein
MIFERRVALFTGVGIICLIAFLVIRNKPFADPNLAIYVRIILSLAIAVLGATVIGNGLKLDFNALGFSIRGVGAAALFVICYFASPKAEILNLNLPEPEVSVIQVKQIDFRSQAAPDKDEQTRLQSPVYITVPVGLKNLAQPGKSAFVDNTKVRFNLANKDYEYNWRNFVTMHEEKYGLWLGLEGDATPYSVASGTVSYKEILHNNDSAMTWGEFLDAIKNSKNEKLKISINLNIDGKDTLTYCEVAIAEWSSKVEKFTNQIGKHPGRVTMPCV